MIAAVALRGILTLWFRGQTVDIDLDGLKLAEVIEYVERKTGKQVRLLAGHFN